MWYRNSIDEAVKLLFVLQERARAHGLRAGDNSAWERLPNRCKPAEWSEGKRQLAVHRVVEVTPSRFEGGSEANSIDSALTKMESQAGFLSAPLKELMAGKPILGASYLAKVAGFIAFLTGTAIQWTLRLIEMALTMSIISRISLCQAISTKVDSEALQIQDNATK